jgi:hypothetical protein
MKKLLAIMVGLAVSTSVMAKPEISGHVGLKSDHLMRGMTMNSGLAAHGKVQADWKGAYAELDVHQNDQNGDAKMMAKMLAGYGKEVIEGFHTSVEYHDYSFRDDWDNKLEDFQEVAVKVKHEMFEAAYHTGLEDAPDYWEVSTDALKYLNISYGDWEDRGANFGVSTSLGNHFGGDINLGWTWFDADDASIMEDDDTIWVSYKINF